MRSFFQFTFITLFLFCTYSVKAQEGNSLRYTFNWIEPIAVGPDKMQKQIYFEGADFDANNPNVPKYCAQTPKNFPKNKSLQFADLVWEPIPSQELAALANFDFPTSPEIELGRGSSREAGPELGFCFYPFAINNGQKSRLVSFTIIPSTTELPRLAQNSFQAKRLSNSLLDAEGWHKLSVTETGIYKITPAFLATHKIGDAQVNINTIRIAGNGGGMLPEAFARNRPVDLIEQPLKINDANNDGIFNGNDYILFYAQSPHVFDYKDGNARYDYVHNIYREANYYFIQVGSGSGKSPLSQASLSNPQVQVSSFDDYGAVEDENVNLVGTGRQWFGDIFEFTLSYNYSFNFPNIITTEPAQLLVDVVGRSSSGNTVMNTRYANQQILSNTIPAYNTFGDYPNFVQRELQRTTFNPQSANITLNLTYDNSANPSGVAWLDKIVLNVRRQLSFAGISNQLHFRDARSVAAGQVVEYGIAQAPNNLTVWDVTDIANIAEISGSFQPDGSYSFSADASSLKEYVAFSGSNFNAPTYVDAVESQNLHGMPIPEMIVISHRNFLPAAEELASFHTDQENVISSVVSVEQIYNEYGSGGADLTAIRDFIKDLYNRSTNNRFKYVLLFGDASYDYKDRLTGNTNFVPTYQSNFSFSLGASFITDDFFAYMDVGEATNFSFSVMDLGVGRVPVETIEQAQVYVDKIKRYVAGEERFGDWQNRILLMADDVDQIWETKFVTGSENLERKAKATSSSFNIEKIYTDAYRQETTTGSQSYPEARRDMFRKVERGCLLVNYIGHGGEIGLSSEKLLQLVDVTSWTNKDALSLFLTITCEFTRFDDPKRVSAGEQLLINPNGGAIALLSTTRVVGAQGAVDLNEAIFDTILVRPGGSPQTLGQIIRAAKNDSKVIGRSTKTKFSLIGDPALRLAVPYNKVVTNTINGKPLNSALQDTAKALSLVEIEGEVQDLGGAKLSDFNGVLSVSVFDKESERKTLVNDGVGPALSFEEQNSLIYRGKVEVANGDFKVDFRVPLGINYKFGNGRISYYAFDSQDRDAAGSYDSILVGGYDDNAPLDNEGPEIELFMNDASFVRGGITGESPFIYARLSDSAGINTVGNGVGQDLRAVLNNKTDQPYILNEFYEADLNSYRSGELRYQLFDLEPGDYTIEMRAFDIYNNPSEVSTDFIVAESADLALRRVLNYPNPFTTYTEFQFEHNRANQNLEVQVQIFTVSGKLVKTINQEVNSLGNRVTGIKWDGLDDYGDKIGKGVYIYRLKIRSQLDNSQADEYEKLVILR